MRQLGVSDVNMEEGSLRCDANISLRPAGSEDLGVKTELKNMNSFRFIERGIRAEAARQEQLLRAGQRVEQETLHFDPDSGRITPLRSKEQAHDYRYFPEPDLVPVAISQDMLDAARAALPELPGQRAARLQQEVGLSADSARLLAFRAELAEYFDAALLAAGAGEGAQAAAHGGGHGQVPDGGRVAGSVGGQALSPDAAQALANWVTVELPKRLGPDIDPRDCNVTPHALAQLAGMVAGKAVSVGAARQVLDQLVAAGGDPATIVQAQGLAAIDGEDELAGIVAAALAANTKAAENMRAGNPKAIGPIVGYVMRETKGRADGAKVTRLVHEQLGI